jgi:hypothetical protein
MTTTCYTGTGARKNGNHSEKQFLKVMDKHFKYNCSKFIVEKSGKVVPMCRPCKTYKTKLKKYIKNKIKNKSLKLSDQEAGVFKKLLTDCSKCKKPDLKSCNLDEYLEFSGAEKGECKKTGGGRRTKRKNSL